MREHATDDPLALWRGVDDAVWREAARPPAAPPPPPRAAPAPVPRVVRELEPA